MFGYVMAELLTSKAKTNHIDPVNWDDAEQDLQRKLYEID
jgi:hypothetical protein